MSIARRFKELDAKLAQTPATPAAPAAPTDDSETLDKALALLRRQQADMKALLQVVADQKARLAEQDKALATLRKMYAAELTQAPATAATPAEASESATKKLLDQRYGKAKSQP